MPPKRSKVTDSAADSDELTTYFSRRYLPTELIQEIMRYLSAESLGRLMLTSRDTGFMVQNWLACSEALVIVMKSLRSPNRLGSSNPCFCNILLLDLGELRNIVSFLRRVTILCPMTERMEWIMHFFSRVKNVEKLHFSWPNYRFSILTKLLQHLVRVSTDSDLDIVVESVLKHSGLSEYVISIYRHSTGLSSYKDFKIRLRIQTFCNKEPRSRAAIVKYLAEQLPTSQAFYFIYVMYGPLDRSKILWMPHVCSPSDLDPLAKFLNEIWRKKSALIVPDLVMELVRFPEEWPLKYTVYFFTQLDKDLCKRLPYLSLHGKDNSRLAAVLGYMAKEKKTLVHTILAELKRKMQSTDFASLTSKVYASMNTSAEDLELHRGRELRSSSQYLRSS